MIKYFANRTVSVAIFCTLALAAACACQPHAGTSAKKINLGTQQAAITLASGTTNDLNVASGGGNVTTVIRLTANSSSSTVTGMSHVTNPADDGDMFLVRNEATSGNVILTNEDTLSVATNRFLTPNASPVVLTPKSSIWIEWDKTALRWVASPGLNGGDQVISSTGHIKGTGTAPALTSCGTSPAIVGSDVAGVVTTGSAATTCTITFAATYTTAPSCFFLPTGTATMPVYTVSATAITVATDIASTVYNYGCVGR